MIGDTPVQSRVLLVDDEEADRVGLATILEGAGFSVEAAESGNEAIQSFVRNPCRVVVTDVVMTDGDGVDLIRMLRQFRPDAAVIAVTGKGSSAVGAARTMGVRRVFEKPVDAAELIEAVHEAMGPARPA
jgi:two-component system response regulator RegA